MKYNKIFINMLIVILFFLCLNVQGATEESLAELKLNLGDDTTVCVYSPSKINKINNNDFEFENTNEPRMAGTNSILDDSYHYLVITLKKNKEKYYPDIINSYNNNFSFNKNSTYESGNCKDYFAFIYNQSDSNDIYFYAKKDISKLGGYIREGDSIFTFNSGKTNSLRKNINNTDFPLNNCSFKVEGKTVSLTYWKEDEGFFTTSNSSINLCPADVGYEGEVPTFTSKTVDVNNFVCNQWKTVKNVFYTPSTGDNCLYYLVDVNANVEGIEMAGDENQVVETGDLLLTYKLYPNGNDSIKIYQSKNTYYAELNDKVLTELSSDAIKSNFEDKDQYPRYIMKLKSSSEYIFSNSVKNEEGKIIETEEIYIESGAFGPSGTGLSDEMIIKTCKELFGNNFLELLNDYVFKVIWIGVPIILILLTTFDFAKVVFSDEKDGMANAFTRLWKRAIAAVLIFLTPYIIIWIANLVDPTQTTVQSCAKKIRQMGNTSYIVK